jgi:hypothetical protein
MRHTLTKLAAQPISAMLAKVENVVILELEALPFDGRTVLIEPQADEATADNGSDARHF